MPKRRTLLCIALAIVAICAALFLCLPRAPRFTQEQFDQIHDGMTQAEVEAVLGCPPGNYAPVSLVSMARSSDDSDDETDWAADTPEPLSNNQQSALCIKVYFDADGKVKDKFCSHITYTPPTLLERLRAWVGW